MTNTTHLALPLIDQNQSQKHVTHNEALRALDAIVHLSVISDALSAPPGSPTNGDRYLVAASPTDDWAGQQGKIAAWQDGAWRFYAPKAGWRAYIASKTSVYVYDGSNWASIVSVLQNLSLLGVGATADANNPFLASLNATLWTAKYVANGGDGDLRFKLNKEAAGDTVSQLYQSNFSGRAETGLTGDDNFHVKVSPDGSAWKESIVVDAATGEVAFPSGGPTKVRVFTSSGAYVPTPGMRFADVLLFGAGGGAGSGARAAPGSAASGGGAGGPGGRARGRFTAAQIGASQPVTIGAPGLGGAAVTTDNTAGANGTQGGFTALGALLKAYGGGAGAGGQIGAGSGGGGAGGPATAGANASGATGGGGSFGVGNGGSAAAGGSSLSADGVGGGGGGCNASGTPAGAGGTVNTNGPPGGGSGGGITAANAPANGANSGTMYVGGSAVVATGGVAGGAKHGGAGSTWANAAGPLEQCGGSGGGGAAETSAAAGNGGDGGLGGGAGGGGGASRNGFASGEGGNAGAGLMIIFEHF